MDWNTLNWILLVLFTDNVTTLAANRATLFPIILISRQKASAVPAVQFTPMPRPTCRPDEYGPDCVYCKSQDTCQHGHYNCDPTTGAKLCLSGWKGLNCTEKDVALDNYFNLTCPANTCRNGGVCMSGTCCCQTGYTGVLCQIETIECQSRPCQNGGICLDRVGRYECLCLQGFTGRNCENHFSITTPTTNALKPQCSTHSCENGGTCYHDLKNTYCVCPLWYSGQLCETSLSKDRVYQNKTCPTNMYGDDCSIFCSPGDSCADGHYICDPTGGRKICLEGWMGMNCNTRRLPQHLDISCPSSLTCKNGGQCFAGQCCCKNRYSGRFCHIESIGCQSSPCHNGATCSPGDIVFEDYNCICANGFEGEYCEKTVHSTNGAINSTSKAPYKSSTDVFNVHKTSKTHNFDNYSNVTNEITVPFSTIETEHVEEVSTEQSTVAQRIVRHTEEFVSTLSSSEVTVASTSDNTSDRQEEISTPVASTVNTNTTLVSLSTPKAYITYISRTSGENSLTPLTISNVTKHTHLESLSTPDTLSFKQTTNNNLFIIEDSTTASANELSLPISSTSTEPSLKTVPSNRATPAMSPPRTQSTSPNFTHELERSTMPSSNKSAHTQTISTSSVDPISTTVHNTTLHFENSLGTDYYISNTTYASTSTPNITLTINETLLQNTTAHSSSTVPHRILNSSYSAPNVIVSSTDASQTASPKHTVFFKPTTIIPMKTLQGGTEQTTLINKSLKSENITGATNTQPSVSPSDMSHLSTSTVSLKSKNITGTESTRITLTDSLTHVNTYSEIHGATNTQPSASPSNMSHLSTSTEYFQLPVQSHHTKTTLFPNTLITQSTKVPSKYTIISSHRAPSSKSNPVPEYIRSPTLTNLDTTSGVVSKSHIHKSTTSSLKENLTYKTSYTTKVQSVKYLAFIPDKPSSPATASRPFTKPMFSTLTSLPSAIEYFSSTDIQLQSSVTKTTESHSSETKPTESQTVMHVLLQNETATSRVIVEPETNSSSWWIIIVGITAGVILLAAICILLVLIFKFILSRESRTLKRRPEEIVQFDKEHFSTEPEFDNPVYMDEPDFQNDTIRSDIYVVNR